MYKLNEVKRMEKNEFTKTKPFLICVDSDGCAMDTMNIKHEKYFGPLAAEVFGIQKRDEFLGIWNRINLYSTTRGINRFKGLVLALQEAIANGEEVGDISKLVGWTETTPELSNGSLAKMVEATPSEDLQKALDWSHKVNTGIEELAGKDAPFPHVQEVLAELHEIADIAIVSSANSEALYSEWDRHSLLPHVDVVYGQEAGTKAVCIEKLKAYGYADDEVLMVGDAPGDLSAALKNNVLYYPILFGKEAFSWKRLSNEAAPNFTNKTYTGEYQDSVIKEFDDLLKQYS